MRSYRLSVRSRAGAIALGIAVVVLGFVVIVSGLALLVGIALIAGLLAGGAVLFRKAFGRPVPPTVRQGQAQRFDPSLEVFPPEGPDSTVRGRDRIGPGDDERGVSRSHEGS